MERATVWCIKYALTAGIVQWRGNLHKDGFFSGKPVDDSISGYWQILPPRDFRADLAEAQKAAEELRVRRIASLEKQLAKLRTMTIKTEKA